MTPSPDPHSLVAAMKTTLFQFQIRIAGSFTAVQEAETYQVEHADNFW
jgi:hypothetical protein